MGLPFDSEFVDPSSVALKKSIMAACPPVSQNLCHPNLALSSNRSAVANPPAKSASPSHRSSLSQSCTKAKYKLAISSSVILAQDSHSRLVASCTFRERSKASRRSIRLISIFLLPTLHPPTAFGPALSPPASR